MYKTTRIPIKAKVLIVFFALIPILGITQIGIQTTTPEAALDISSTSEGLLIPRTGLTSINDITTISNPQGGGVAISTLVYNDGTGGLSPAGFYYWNGTIWVNLSSNNYWRDDGNSGTNPAANYLGTSDNQNLSIRTNNTEVLSITTPDGSGDPKIEAGNNGNNGDEQDPLYTFSNDDNTGIWSDGGDEFSLGAGGQEFITVDEGPDEVIINEDGDAIDFRVETDNNPNQLFVDGTNNRIGIKTNTPATDIHIAGNNTTTRIDAFNSANNPNNNAIDLSAVYVDANGDLVLGGPLIHSNMPIDNATTFVPATVNITSNTGAWAQATLHTTTVTVTQNSLLEVVYQIGTNIVNRFGGPITDGDPRQYGSAAIINGTVVGYSSESYTSSGSGIITSGTYFLNGNGYLQVAPGTHTIQIVGFVFGANQDNVRGEFGGNGGLDRIQVIIHH